MIWPHLKKQDRYLTNFPVLETFRLLIRPPQPEDYPQWAAVRRRNQSYLKPYEPAWPEGCLKRGAFEKRLAQQNRNWRQGLGHAFLIFEKKTQTLIGGININNVNRGAGQYAALGYWLDREKQDQGYMREALRAVIHYGFNTLKLHRFNAACLPGNERSTRLLLKLGFEEEGFAQKYIQIDGQWQDHRLFGLPIEHWQ